MIFLGIDGGGSKTSFLAVDEQDREVRKAQSGPSNWLSVGRTAAATAIREGVAQLRDLNPDIVCGGFAGAGRPEGLQFYRSVLEPLFPSSRVIVESDATIGYAGAIGLKPGVLLIAGTGSIAIGRLPNGSMIRAGGWGPHFGDEGGGFWIGREAVRRALYALDTGASMGFASQIAQRLGLGSIQEVVAAWGEGKISVPNIAALFPAVVAMWPNEPAAQILKDAAGHLRRLATTALERVGAGERLISASGSVATHALMRQLMDIEYAEPLASAEYGAILLARNAK